MLRNSTLPTGKDVLDNLIPSKERCTPLLNPMDELNKWTPYQLKPPIILLQTKK